MAKISQLPMAKHEPTLRSLEVPVPVVSDGDLKKLWKAAEGGDLRYRGSLACDRPPTTISSMCRQKPAGRGLIGQRLDEEQQMTTAGPN